MRIAFWIITLIALATPVRVAAQIIPKPAAGKRPRFSITVEMPPVIKPETPLEIIMTNRTEEDIGYGFVCGWPLWAKLFHIDLRDSEGKRVPETPIGQQIIRGPSAVTCVRALALKPHQQLRQQVVLKKVFALSKSGKYSVQVQRVDADGIAVNSNTLSFLVLAQSDNH